MLCRQSSTRGIGPVWTSTTLGDMQRALFEACLRTTAMPRFPATVVFRHAGHDARADVGHSTAPLKVKRYLLFSRMVLK